ncbi:uncharacterized protein [Nicotiana tomentosiformis]|uniref:Uncharacterized protein n=1 Tax=Nicotiana tabacum TaxID=4097 RepID=A0A1S4BXF7_TOBAC|nr:uncharacterized protein LOC104098211 [Nicotiana tomentosiformis]XP_016493464.1 PREDICTED: uncharacterized protein LOC107812806 [Nicotiana tabacum]XP_018626994.1 uncharacterized protein LOC104098211 [Nicotiana tomentosiformis]
MMRFLGSLSMLRLLMWLFWLPRLGSSQLADFSPGAARALDAVLQDYAYLAFDRPRIRTGVVYDANVPSNLTGIKVSALRLRSGSLRRRGVEIYKEFKIPIGIIEQPYVERLVLVYQNLGNWSSRYYNLPGYIYLAPMLGLLAYDASNLSAINLPELDIKASVQPISISFSDVKSLPVGSSAKCVSIDLQGSVNFSNVLADNTCTTFQQGHFSIVIESIAPSPAPVPPTPASVSPPKGKKGKSKVLIIIGSVAGGLVLLFLLGLLIMCASKYEHKKKIQQMERAAEVGEALHMTRVGSTKAPFATVTRTQPTLETEYRP